MSVRYEGDDGNPELELVDSVNTKKSTIDSVFGCYGKLSTLLAWNKSDPVSSFERRRNEVIYKHQGNRNPFIDHPEFADRIWGNGPIIKDKKPGISNQQNKPMGIVSGEFTKSINPTGVILSEKGEKIKEFEFSVKSDDDYKELRPGKYILIITRDGKEQKYKVKITK